MRSVVLVTRSVTVTSGVMCVLCFLLYRLFAVSTVTSEPSTRSYCVGTLWDVILRVMVFPLLLLLRLFHRVRAKVCMLFALITVADSAREKRHDRWYKRWHPLYTYCISFLGGLLHKQASVGTVATAHFFLWYGINSTWYLVVVFFRRP